MQVIIQVESLKMKVICNLCTQMAIRFREEMKIKIQNHNIAIFVHSKIEKKKLRNNVLLLIFFNQFTRK